jgi:hypothetical protein
MKYEPGSIAEFLNSIGIDPENMSEFKPCARYFKFLNVVQVYLEDSSYTAIHLDDMFTIYKRNHTDELIYDGFEIYTIKDLFTRDIYTIEEIVNTMVDACKYEIPKLIQELLLHCKHLEVDFRK